MDPEAGSRDQAGRLVHGPDMESPGPQVRARVLPEVGIPVSGLLGGVFPVLAKWACRDRGAASLVPANLARARVVLGFPRASLVEELHSARPDDLMESTILLQPCCEIG